ncbi:hypothetical protein Pelo_16957 [Pelomyxa schiedti]|nr:hypothetical protein Pelo_16957 [Pelomyxa schiedti]
MILWRLCDDADPDGDSGHCKLFTEECRVTLNLHLAPIPDAALCESDPDVLLIAVPGSGGVLRLHHIDSTRSFHKSAVVHKTEPSLCHQHDRVWWGSNLRGFTGLHLTGVLQPMDCNLAPLLVIMTLAMQRNRGVFVWECSAPQCQSDGTEPTSTVVVRYAITHVETDLLLAFMDYHTVIDS